MTALQRREFIKLLGGAAAWPLALRAQQPVMPVIGYLEWGSPEARTYLIAAFRNGLAEAGYFEGRNLRIEYRFADNAFDGLPELAADLVRHQVAVICVAASTQTALVAKAATTTIPIDFGAAGDPVKFGLVASLNRPGGNVTGISSMGIEILPKLLGILQELLPTASRIAVLMNPNGGAVVSTGISSLKSAANTIGKQVEVLAATTNREIDRAFASLVQMRADALLVIPSPLFSDRRVQIVTLASRHVVPAIYYDGVFAEAGGLMSYGPSYADQARQVGVYTGRILKGEKPADLPVIQASKFDFIINLQTAMTLGVNIPASLLAQANEVIE
jgi:putative ABC transport system substrate-binding protein